jgi:hypothetical protein
MLRNWGKRAAIFTTASVLRWGGSGRMTVSSPGLFIGAPLR